MYDRFFGFTERPFKLLPNPAFLYLSRTHEEVLAHLNYAAGYGDGFVEITGEVGTGKTTLCRMFLEQLDEDTVAAYIFNPKLDARQLLKAINDEFGIPSDTDSIKTLIDTLNAFLLEQKALGRRVILLVDEAQNLSADVLEQLRLLSNLETTTSKLLQIILVGQPELNELLESGALRQLNQRITLSCHLVPLTFDETCDYIRHRIHIASNKPGPAFSTGAFRAIFRFSGGVPRLINIICDRALLTAFTLGQHRITTSIVQKAAGELKNKRGAQGHPNPMRRWGKQAVGLLVVLVVLTVALFLLHRPDRTSVSPVARHPIDASPPHQAPDDGIRTVQPPPSTATAPAAPLPAATAAPPAPPGQLPAAAASPIPLTKPPAAAAPTSIPRDPPSTTAASPTAEPAPSAAAMPASPPAPDLLSALAVMDEPASRRDALQAVLEKWDVPMTTPLDLEETYPFFRIAARQHGLEALRFKGNLNVIRKLNLPAILECSLGDGGGMRFVAVVGVSLDEVQLSAGENTYSRPPLALVGLWNGVAYVLWKNHFNYAGVIPISSSGEDVLSLKAHLRTLGFPIDGMTPAYDNATRRAVETIQARNGLDVDGMVGALTKIVLYNMDPSLAIPRLNPIQAWVPDVETTEETGA